MGRSGKEGKVFPFPSVGKLWLGWPGDEKQQQIARLAQEMMADCFGNAKSVLDLVLANTSYLALYFHL